MPTLVSTGQITIVDNNDARPITAFIAASGPTQQVFSKDESATSYLVDWTTTNLVLTPKVYVGASGAATEVAASLSNKKWSNDLSTSIGTGTTFTVNTNLTEATPSKIYYFEGDYTDPVTGLVSHVVSSIVLNLVKTGTNAVYIQVRGGNVLEPGKNIKTVTLTADLIRASGVDDTGVTYKWYKSPFAAADQIDGNLANVTTHYGFLDTAAANAGVAGAIGSVKTTAGGTTTAITTTNAPDGAYADFKSLVISDAAVADIGIYKVEARDADTKVYQQFFTVYDISDPYDIRMVSTAGDKLQNGVGSTDIYPDVFYGATRVGDLTSWSFLWEFYNKDGKKGGFVDTSRTAVATGRNITANTAGTAAVFTYDGAAITFAAGDVIKAVRADGAEFFYNVASGTGNTVTISAGAGNNAFLSFANFAAPVTANDFLNGKLFVCRANGVQTTAGANANPAAAKITVTGYEIDAKGTITCAATRP